MTKQEICNKLDVSTKTFERFLADNPDIESESNGSSHEKDFKNGDIVTRFKKWLVKRQINQGKKTGSKKLLSAIKDSAK